MGIDDTDGIVLIDPSVGFTIGVVLTIILGLVVGIGLIPIISVGHGVGPGVGAGCWPPPLPKSFLSISNNCLKKPSRLGLGSNLLLLF